MAGLDLASYLARIGYRGSVRPDLETLRALQLAHLEQVPFENLDIQMGLSIRLELEALEDKLVRRRRGGYCFEQNTLFLAALRELGFQAAPCEARVRSGASEIRPRTHMLLRVRLAASELLADVGFGGQGPLEPVPMDGKVHEQAGGAYRVVEQGAERVLGWRRPEGWLELYSFVAEERPPVDFLVANHFTSTWPESSFVQTLTVQLATREARHILRNLTYTILAGSALEERSLARHELLPLLRERFGLELPADARFRALDG